MKNKSYLPNILTILNLCSGFAAITVSFHGKYENSLLLMLIALVFDGLDGKVASFLNSRSDYGTELDAFADVVSFAVLPGLCIYQFYQGQDSNGFLGLLLGLGYTVSGVLRLARFNVYQSTGGNAGGFVGLPMPPLGLLIISIIILAQMETPINREVWAILLAAMIVIGSYLMVSNIQYKKYGDSKSTSLLKPIIILQFIVLILLAVIYFFIDQFTLIVLNLVIFSSIVYIAYPIWMVLFRQSKTQMELR